MMVACQWKWSSPAGPAEHDVGGSFKRSCSRAAQEDGGGGAEGSGAGTILILNILRIIDVK